MSINCSMMNFKFEGTLIAIKGKWTISYNVFNALHITCRSIKAKFITRISRV